jgi:DUF4097 and DUF4098 domain-containing protein YvlB
MTTLLISQADRIGAPRGMGAPNRIGIPGRIGAPSRVGTLGRIGTLSRLGLLWLFGAALPCSFAHAAQTIAERRNADPQGMVEIVDLSGDVDVMAWDRPEVEITGTVGDSDRVDITRSGSRTSINVVSRSGMRARGETTLVMHVPAHSSVSAALVSADLSIEGVRGDVKLQTVNGDVKGEVAGDLRVSTVSGSVHMKAPEARNLEVKTISGDIQLSGGSGDVEVATVSGTARVTLGTVARAHFKSISGDLHADLMLSPDARLEGESVSGTVDLDFASTPLAQFDVQSFSGTIKNCFGPKAAQSDYGIGSRLNFRSGSGNGDGRVRIATQSGTVKLCAKDLPAAAANPPAGLEELAAARDARSTGRPAPWPVSQRGSRSVNVFYSL